MSRRKNILSTAALLMGLVLLVALFSAGCTPRVNDEGKGGEDGDDLAGGEINLATTTSTYDSGLLDYLHPVFKEKTGIEVKVISQGSRQAIEMGRNGDVDVLLVHDRKAELELVSEGLVVDRVDVMYNDFIIAGPAVDPSGLKDAAKAVEALQKIAAGGAEFISRGDDSEIHRLELSLWETAGVDVAEDQDWYIAAGSGMGDTLRMAQEKKAYCMTDRRTYVAMKEDLDLVILFEGDPALFNQYGVMAINPEVHEHVKYDLAKKYVDFLASDEGRELISSYKVAEEILFFPGCGLED